MANAKVKSNKNTLLAAGAKSGIADILKPTLAELAALTNVSEATKWDGYDLGFEASETDEDRALTDSATASSRGYENFGGSVSFYKPVPGETDIYKTTENIVLAPHVELALVQRDGYAADAAWAAGQVFNSFHVITDAPNEQRGDKKRFYSVAFKNKGYAGVNRIVPSASATAVTITGTAAVDVDETTQLKASYEGNDITVGADWVSSDSSVAIVTPHGKVIGVSAGTADISATYPGSAAGTPTEVTVSA